MNDSESATLDRRVRSSMRYSVAESLPARQMVLARQAPCGSRYSQRINPKGSVFNLWVRSRNQWLGGFLKSNINIFENITF